MSGRRSTKTNVASPDYWFFLAIIGIVLYLLLFFRSSFGPLASFVPNRASLFTLLLNPTFFVELWCGEPARFAIFDRLPLYLAAAGSLLAAYGLGQIALRLLRITDFLDPLERFVFSTATGLSLFSTFLLILGLCGLANQCWPVRILTAGFALYGARVMLPGVKPNRPSFTAFGLGGLLVIPYLLVFPLPPIEYDVVSYHLPGVKETFLTGFYGFRTDSVYTNMPFGAEMHYLWGMLLYGDWYHGALAGKIVVGLTGSLLPAAALYAFCRHFFTKTVGVLAAILYLTNPWIYYVSATGLIDGVVATYLFTAAYALILYRYPGRKYEDYPRQPMGLLLLSGFLAGSAVSCKYPALLFVVVPLAGAVGFSTFSHRLRKIAFFSLAALLACGLWFGKNAVLTGNPTYPLLYGVFGDRTGTWTPEKNARWTRVHSPHDFSLASACGSTAEIAWKSDYQSPILVPLAVCGFIPIFFRLKKAKGVEKKEDRLLLAFAAHLFFVFVCWWFLTHRLDRFLIPILPLATIFAARGAVISADPFWRKAVLVVFAIAIAYATLLAALPQPGKYNRFFLPDRAMRTDPIRVMPHTLDYNENPPRGTLLLLGEAKAFDFNVPVLFSSCFNDSLFERIVKDNDGSIRSPEEIRRLFHEYGISDIFVDWGEIARFRSPGNYGFSDFIEPKIFDELVRDNVLRPTGTENETFRVID